NDEGIAHYQKFSEKRKALVNMQGKPLVQIVLQLLGLSFNLIVTRKIRLAELNSLKLQWKNSEALYKTFFLLETQVKIYLRRKLWDANS
ncbi:MAG: hypothetical protein ACUVTC_06840, partial [Candidatus Bathycorpusculaceae bacterium]